MPAGADEQVIVLCDHGFSSVLAAASLADLGFARAGDVVGGFVAWRDAGLPTIPAPRLARRTSCRGWAHPPSVKLTPGAPGCALAEALGVGAWG